VGLIAAQKQLQSNFWCSSKQQSIAFKCHRNYWDIWSNF